MLALGLATGLAAAFCQSVSYLFGRRFLLGEARSSFQLLVMAHLLMGGASFALMPLLWKTPHAGLDWTDAIGPLAGTAGFYLFGQTALFVTMRFTPASRVAPLLGLKVLFVATFRTVLGWGALTLWEWAAAALAAVAALLLYRVDVRLRWPALVGVCLTCSGYALSDNFIHRFIAVFDPGRGPAAACFANVLTYALCGLVALPLALKTRPDRRQWAEATPFAGAWFLAMFFLFSTIGLVGVVLAVILQSTRGLWSIALGRWAARRWSGLEWVDRPGETPRRIAAAVLMLGAVTLYALSR